MKKHAILLVCLAILSFTFITFINDISKLFLLQFSPNKYPAYCEKPENPNDIKEYFSSHFLKIYGLKTSFPSQNEYSRLTNGAIQFDTAEGLSLAEYLFTLDRELSVYPDGFLASIRLSQIVVCKNLIINNEKANAAFEANDRILFLDSFSQNQNALSERRAIHHELFHAVDRLYDLDKIEWESLNSTGFAYSAKDFALPQTSTPGFISNYSKFNASEDRAELFSFLITKHSEVLLKSKEDNIIFKKSQLLKSFIAKHFVAIDKSFWDNIDKKTKY